MRSAAATGNKEEAVSLFLPSLFHVGGVEEITFLPLYPLPGITTAADRAEAVVGPFADGLSPPPILGARFADCSMAWMAFPTQPM